MARRSRDDSRFVKALDQWTPPEGAGEAVACLATTFTFDAAFFETECLGRFLDMDTHPSESTSAAYLVEREEKLAGSYAAVLVDRQHSGQKESLRWDVLPVRVPGATQHAKVSLLVWANAARVIVGSGNLTTPGYRHNLEVFGSVDFDRTSASRVDIGLAVLAFIEGLLEQTPGGREGEGPSPRVFARIGELRGRLRSWPAARVDSDLSFVPGTPQTSVIERLGQLRPAGGQTRFVEVVAPFFERDPRSNEVVAALAGLAAQRGDRQMCLDCPVETLPGGETVVRASKKLVDGLREGGADVLVHPVLATQRGEDSSANEIRPLHAKMFWLESDRAVTVMIGSSNCTAAGLGTAAVRNSEANLVYQARLGTPEHKALLATWPATRDEPLDLSDPGLRWEPAIEEGDDATGELLPAAFEEALFKAAQPQELRLRLGEGLPAVWAVKGEDGTPVADSTEAGAAGAIVREWHGPSVPVVLVVTWQADGRDSSATWPVNVLDPAALPPPEALRNLTLEELIEVLASTRPLHRAIDDVIERRNRRAAQKDDVELDPHRRVNTEEFLLRRTRRVAMALDRLRERLDRPALSEQSLAWRLEGPLGPVALAEAFVRDARSPGEAAFFLAELALTLARVRPGEIARGGAEEAVVAASLSRVRDAVRGRVDGFLDDRVSGAMRAYVVEAVGSVAI
ncbi:MAG: hypothetical protein ABS80_20670 [Pseudonocardia sp. SCN 72-51]|nr:MAG: hypothetical protein ABS80_20670 [Pseudonocardia sp. SCN 72-51]